MKGGFRMKQDVENKIGKENQFTLRNLYFNRFLLIRYLTASFFFANIYWLLALWLSKSMIVVIPILLLVGLIVVVSEQFQLLSKLESNMINTKIYYYIQITINLCLMVTTWTSGFKLFFPFINTLDKNNKFIVDAVLLLGIVLAIIILRRLNKISRNEDAQYTRILAYKKTLMTEGGKNNE